MTDEPAGRSEAEAQPARLYGRSSDSSTQEEQNRPYDTYEEVVTPNGSGYVVAQGPDGVLVNEGGTYDLYPAERLSRPGEARPPEPVDVAGEERRAWKLAAAISPEGLELYGDNARLARLNLDEGHGEVLDSAGKVIGWIRRRGRTWYGQDARGGIRSSTSWTESKKGGPIRAAELMAGSVAMHALTDRTMFGGEPFRHIRPEEVTAPIFYAALTEAQTRELRTLAAEWKTVADPDLRTAAERWSQGITTAQMRRLATAVDEVAAHADTTTPQGRRDQGVLQRLAANVRIQAHAAEGAFSTLPPPGEPDPWARPYRAQEPPLAADVPTNTVPQETPANLPETARTDAHSQDDAPQPEATGVQLAPRGVAAASPTPRSGGPSPASKRSGTPPTSPLGSIAPRASTAPPAATAPDTASEEAPPNAPDPSAAPATAAEARQPAGARSAPANALADNWTLTLPDLGAPHSEEAAAAAWAMRGALTDHALIDLMAALGDDDAFTRWKSRHMLHYGAGTGHVNKDLAPGDSVSYKHSAQHLEARIADQTVKVTWDRIRAWLREATTPEALSLLHAAEEAGARLRDDGHGDSLLAATGELALARSLRAQCKQLTTQVLDHVTQFMATTPIPTGRRSKPSARAAAGTALFDLNEAPIVDLPGAEQVRADLDRLIAYLPDPRADREPQTVPLSALRTGMVLDRNNTPVVITEIIRHPGRCDIIGEFRGPIWPARIKHSVELPEQDSDPLIPLAPVLPSLYELTGRQPEPDDDESPGPLVEGHPVLAAPAGPRPPAAVAAPLAPPVRRLPDLVWDEQRRRAHGQALADLGRERPPLSAQRRELDPDDPFAQFTDNLEHQLQQLADHPDEHAAVANAAQHIHDTVTDLAARARAYSTERLRTAESNPAELLQLTLEPSRTAPFVRIAINTIMRAIDTAEDAVTSARAKARVRAALTATVCSSPPHDPQGDSPQDFDAVLIEFEAVASNEYDTVAELLAGPAQWAHFAQLAAHVEAATATPNPNPPSPRFANLDELRAHLADLVVRPLPDIEVHPAGITRHKLRERAKYAGQLATDPTLELTPSRRLAIHSSAGGGWHVVAPGSANAIVPWPVKSRRRALRYAALLERLTDAEGNAYPWDADDFPSTQMPYEPQGGHLLYDYVESNHSHHSLGFHHRLKVLRGRSQAYGWMEGLSLYRFSDFDYIHPASPADLQPGDEVMFTFDQDELAYAQSVAGYFPPPRVDNLAIGTAVVGENLELIPGFWWPERHPEQAQRLTQPVALRDGGRRPRPGEYTLHAGITAYLPELTAHQTLAAALQPTPAAQASLRVENGSPPNNRSAAERETSPPAAADDRIQQAGRQGRAAKGRRGTGGQTVDQQMQIRAEDGPEAPLAPAPAAPIEAEAAPAPPPEGPAAPTADLAEIIPDTRGPVPDDSAQEDSPDASALPAEPTAAPPGTDEEPDTVPDAPSAEAAAAPGDQLVRATLRPGLRPQLRPGAGQGEGTAPPGVVAAEEPTAPDQTTSRDPRLSPEAPEPYRDAAAYAAAHEALLTELDQHQRWLARTPAAEKAAITLTGADTLGLPGLNALLALRAPLALDTDGGNQRTRLVQQLSHHIRCAQLTMAKLVLGQAAHSTDTEQLRELHRVASQGQFIAFVQQTEDGEMELGHYLQHRAEQVAQQPVGTEELAEQTSETAEEANAMAWGPDDDSQLPIFDRPGESLMTVAEAAPRLLAQAQAHLETGEPGVSLLAHIHGRPVYALVEDGTPAPVLLLGLAAVDEAGSARAVTIPGAELSLVAPETLLAAVTTWMNASDDGRRALLDYAPSASAPAPGPPAPEQRRLSPAEAEQPALATAPVAPPATSAAPSATEPQSPQESAELPASDAPAILTAQDSAAQTTSDVADGQPAEKTPAGSDASAAKEPETPPVSTGASSAQAESAARPDGEQRQEGDGAQQAETTPAGPAEQLIPAMGDPVDQLTALARSALTGLGVTLEATGVLTADRTVVVTLETSGNADQDREIADNLRSALHEAIRQHPDRGLSAYRVDVQHTPQVGQGAFQVAPGVQAAGVSRERLIAANRAAARIFAEWLQSHPNAKLARIYLAEERQLPPDVQQQWGLGYAPSDGRAGGWDLLVRALRGQGFTDEELLQAGLAKRSRRDTLIDPFRDRIMFAIHDEHGDIVGFSGRRIDRPGETEEQAKARGGPKYFNTSNDAVLFRKGDMVFGLHHPAQAQALASSSGPRVSVEGYLDAIAVARATATVPPEQRPVVGAPMGTAFTERQLTALRGLDTDNPRSHIVFLDADDSGRKVLLDKWDLLLQAGGETTVTSAPDAKDAAKLWEEGIKTNGDGATPVLRVLEQRQPLLNAAIEAVLMKNADEGERANHAFDSTKYFPRTRAIAAEAALYIHQAVQTQAPGNTAALEQAALDWAKRLDQDWNIPGHMTATAVLLGPGNHPQDNENEVYEQALDLLATDPEGYFANDAHVRSRQSAADSPVTEPAPPLGPGPGSGDARPGQWPVGTRGSGPATSPSDAGEAAPTPGALALSMFLPSPIDAQPVEHTDRTTAAYALHTAVHERLGQHTAESPEPGRLPHPLYLGTIHGVEMGTSGDDQAGEDPTVVVWLGSARSDSLRLSYSRFVVMTGPELLAAVEWRAAQAAGLLGTPLSQTWRDAVRTILPPAFPAQPTPVQFADLLDTIAQGGDAGDEGIRHRAQQAVALYTAGHADLALNHLAATDHIWVLRNDGSWIQEEAPSTALSWEELDNGFSQQASELADVAQAAGEFPAADQAPMAADLTVAHHSAHEALETLRPYSIGLPGTIYERITDLVAQMDGAEPALRRLRGPDGEQLMNRAKMSFVRVLEGLATVASKIRLFGLSTRLEHTVARLRGQDPSTLPAPRAVRVDRRMQDLAHIERDLERRMAAPTTTLAERGGLQEQWIINRARWRARYEQLTGQPLDTDFLPDNGLVAGAPPVPNLTAAHDLLLDRLAARVAELRDTDPHTGEDSNPYEPTADLFNGVAWAYQQRLVGAPPTGKDPQGPIPNDQLRQAALTVTSHQHASPLTLRRAMNVTAERADRILHRLEEQQILGPYRPDAPRTVLARPADIDALLARPATPPARRKPAAEPVAAPTTRPTTPPGPDALDEARIHKMVSKILADQQKRSEAHGEPDSAERAAHASRVPKPAHKEAEANALAAGQSTSLVPSQS
ncbi:toprim domain-containing protein [Streptomyces syringium]|uniref:toprim domain-containing protein n=1 Tax=Streptomyces syringium TaxID=76729 RepID=UPI00343FDE30